VSVRRQDKLGKCRHGPFSSRTVGQFTLVTCTYLPMIVTPVTRVTVTVTVQLLTTLCFFLAFSRLADKIYKNF